MTTANREQQILRIKSTSFQAELDEQLKEHLQQEVVSVVQTTIEAALVEELTAQLAEMSVKSRRSGYYPRRLDTQFGQVEKLSVPKLRYGNKEREWRILDRYQLKVQTDMESRRQAPITKTPPILIVDGVWVDVHNTQWMNLRLYHS